MSNAMPKSFNLFTPEVFANPYPTYAQLRALEPVYWSEKINSWFITRYADVASSLQHPALSPLQGSRNPAVLARLPSELREKMVSISDFLSVWLLFLPHADHRRIRRLMMEGFKPRLVAQLGPRIQAIADELLSEVEGTGQMEVIQDFAYPLPAMVIAEMLGVPSEDRHLLKAWSKTMLTFFTKSMKGYGPVIEDMSQAVTEMTSYLRQIVAERRRKPQDDMISHMLAAEEEGKLVSEEELLSNCVLLLFAGHETTMNLIGNGLCALLHHPEQYEKLVHTPALITTAVEEFLRYDSPVQFIGRTTLTDVEIGGQQIRAGQRTTLILGAANRDPAQFYNPDDLDITRQNNKHLTFGYGPHFCLGAALARLEAQIAFNTLLRRLPRLQLATESVTWRPGFPLRGLQALPAMFEQAY